MGTEEEKTTNINNFELMVMKKNRIWIYLLYTMGIFLIFLNISFKSIAQASSETVKDVDGNVYKIVRIGNQTWIAENLKTTKFNDGTAISWVPDSIAWTTLTTPAYCWYRNDEVTNKNIYGALYNWYTVNTKKLCPTGWHIPSDTELKILINYVGGELGAGEKLREVGTTHWSILNPDATNEIGFTALPGGRRDGKGAFSTFGSHGWWWSAREIYSSAAIYRFIYTGSPSIGKIGHIDHP